MRMEAEKRLRGERYREGRNPPSLWEHLVPQSPQSAPHEAQPGLPTRARPAPPPPPLTLTHTTAQAHGGGSLRATGRQASAGARLGMSRHYLLEILSNVSDKRDIESASERQRGKDTDRDREAEREGKSERDGGRERGRESARERERARERARKGGRKGERKGGREGGREGERREGGREGGGLALGVPERLLAAAP